MATWRNGDLMPEVDDDGPSVRRTLRTSTTIQPFPPSAAAPVSVIPGQHRVSVGRVLGRLAFLPVGIGVLGFLLWLLNAVIPQYAVVVGGILAVLAFLLVVVCIVADERDDLD